MVYVKDSGIPWDKGHRLMKTAKQTQRQIELAHMKAVDSYSDHYRIQMAVRQVSENAPSKQKEPAQ